MKLGAAHIAPTSVGVSFTRSRIALKPVILFEIVRIARRGSGRFPQHSRLKLTLECGHIEYRSVTQAERDAYHLGKFVPPKKVICDECRREVVHAHRQG